MAMALPLTSAAAAIGAVAQTRSSFGAAASSSNATSHSALFGTLPCLKVASSAARDGRREVTGSARAVAMQDSLTGRDEDSEGMGELGLGQREIRQYPPGLQRYETMAVLRPDLTEDQRLSLTQRYEEVNFRAFRSHKNLRGCRCRMLLERNNRATLKEKGQKNARGESIVP